MQKEMKDDLIRHNVSNNLTIMNTIYHKATKLPNGKYTEPQMDLVYKDNDTGRKGVQTIMNPEYEFFELNDDVPLTDYPLDFAEKEQVHPVRCKYQDLMKTIAEHTDNKEFYFMNKQNGNYKANKALFLHPKILNADMNINDHYRYRFNKRYDNPITPITKMYFDIECDTVNMKGDFPELGECPVNAISCIFNDMVYSFVLRDTTNPSMVEFENEVTGNPGKVEAEFVEFIKDYVGGDDPDIYDGRLEALNLTNFDIKFQFYNDEMQLIRDFFFVVNTLKPDFVLAWNMGFDTPTIIERIKKNGLDPAQVVCSKDFKNPVCEYVVDYQHYNEYEERGDFSNISGYSAWVCQMIQFASRRKGQSAIENFKIDYIGELICGVKKLDYSHICKNIKDFPRANFKMFILYNIIDTIVQKCIEERVLDIDYLFTNAVMFNTRYSKTHRQSVYLTNKKTQSYWDNGYIKGNNPNIYEEKKPFPGAFVADLNLISNYPREYINEIPLRLFKNLNDFDYSRLYPTLYQQWNMCRNGLIAQLIFPEPQKYENRLNVEAYSRAGAFAQDYHSRNYIDFGHRWFNLPDYKSMVNYVRDYYSQNVSMGVVDYFDKSQDNTIYAFGPRKEKKTLQMPTRTAIAYSKTRPPHHINPYTTFKGDMSKVFIEQSEAMFQNRPDVVVKKQLIGVEKI